MAWLKRSNIMLAYPAEEKRIKQFPLTEGGQRNFFHQPKLNGERARTEWFGTDPFLISSYGNDFRFLDLIQKEIAHINKYIGVQWVKFDGEVYVHGWSRERIDSALRRKVSRNPDVEQLQYHLFDYQSAGTATFQWERLRFLGLVEQLIEKDKLQHIKVVPYGICSEVDWIHHCAEYCEDGYEGIILRNPFGLYVEKRTVDLLKFKPTETDTYVIKSVTEAVSKDGEPKGMVGAFEVYAKDEPGGDVTFKVGAGKLPHLARIAYYQRKEELVGKELLVKHELLRTTNQVPVAAVSVRVIE